jgi:hypothetical protein
MALVLPHSIFFHVGRTAGHCVRKTIREMGIPTYDVGQFHDCPSNIPLTEEERGKLFFCFVRHPLAWLKSFWCYEMYFGWGANEYSRALHSESFAGFLEKAIAAYPSGAATEVFRPFVTQCREVGRQETLAADLSRILNLAGEEFNPNVLERMGVVTVDIDRNIRRSATAPKELLQKVLDTERDTCERFHYTGIPESLIGPAHACLAPFVPLGNSKHPVPDSVKLAPAISRAFIINGECFDGPPAHRMNTMAVLSALEEIEFSGKDVIDTSCREGAFCFFAESKGASSVLGVIRDIAKVTTTLKAAMESRVEFIDHNLYGLEQATDQKFDIAFCFDRLQSARYPLLLIRTLSRLMKEGGTLVIACQYLNACDGIPIVYLPLGSESPAAPEACSYFNKGGLVNALATYGFHDFNIRADFFRGVDKARDFTQMPFPRSREYHDSESDVGELVLTCRYSPSAADQDSRYALDAKTGQSLTAWWDSELPRNGLPSHQPDPSSLMLLVSQIKQDAIRQAGLQAQEVRRLDEELRAAQSAIHDRVATIEATRSELVARTRELDRVRQELIERTARLEQMHLAVDDRTADLVETRRLLTERTAMLEKMVERVKSLTGGTDAASPG